MWLGIDIENVIERFRELVDAGECPPKLALSGLTPYEYIAKVWTSEPHRFIVDPIHRMPGLNT